MALFCRMIISWLIDVARRSHDGRRFCGRAGSNDATLAAIAATAVATAALIMMAVALAVAVAAVVVLRLRPRAGVPGIIGIEGGLHNVVLGALLPRPRFLFLLLKELLVGCKWEQRLLLLLLWWMLNIVFDGLHLMFIIPFIALDFFFKKN